MGTWGVSSRQKDPRNPLETKQRNDEDNMEEEEEGEEGGMFHA